MERNGDSPATTPAMDAQMLLALVQGVDRLTKEIEALREGLEQLKGEAGEIRGAVESNQEKLKAMNSTLGDLGAAANLALHRLPPHGAAPPPRSELAARIRAARGEEAVLLEQLAGHVYALREDAAARIDSLAGTYQVVIGEMDRLLHERFDEETQAGASP